MQTTDHILLVRPASFCFNAETAVSNAFQQQVNISDEVVKQKVSEEFELFAKLLQAKGVDVSIIDDTVFPLKPDAIFPNNWISFHADGKVILYPMNAPNRRNERREDVLEILRKKFVINEQIDLSKFENNNKFLEGTGSVVFDHTNHVAYACISPRTDKDVFLKLTEILNYKPVCFHAFDENGHAIYHTNVMICIAEKFTVICLDSIADKHERELVKSFLKQTGHEIIEISFRQMKNFSGNMLALKSNTAKDLLVMSKSAFDNLHNDQIKILEQYCELVPQEITTIETIGGGSARCMIAEIFLPLVNENHIRQQ